MDAIGFKILTIALIEYVEGQLYISDDEFTFLHPMSSPVVVPVSELLSMQFYDGVRLFYLLRTVI